MGNSLTNLLRYRLLLRSSKSRAPLCGKICATASPLYHACL